MKLPVSTSKPSNQTRDTISFEVTPCPLNQNGEIVTADERYVADIFCEGEIITRIDRNIAPSPGVEIIDAAANMFSPFH